MNDKQLESKYLDNKIRVLVVDPLSKPYIAYIENELEASQEMVQGYIEMVDLSDSAVLVCNEEGKLLHLQANRKLGKDVIVGRFFIAGQEDGGLVSLSWLELDNYATFFEQPENKHHAPSIHPISIDF